MTKDQLVKAGKVVANPLRLSILELLRDATKDAPVSPRMASRVMKEDLSQVSYHFKVLRDCGAITLVKTVPRRGAVEHYYSLDAESPLVPVVLGLIRETW